MNTREEINDCREFINEVKKKLDFLFENFQFEVLQVSDRKGGEDCMVVLENPTFRIRLYKERHSILLSFGNKNAHLQWPDVEQDKYNWHSSIHIFDYLSGHERKTFNEMLKVGKNLYNMTTEDQLNRIESQLRSNIEDLSQIFSGTSKDFSLGSMKEYVWKSQDIPDQL